MKSLFKSLTSFLLVGILCTSLAAQTAGTGGYDTDIQARVVQELAKKQEFRNLHAVTEGGMVTLTGTVETSAFAPCG